MNPFEFVLAILFLVFTFRLVQTRMTSRHRVEHSQGDSAETQRLREELKQLKERLHVLERIATDRENSLAREIEELRDR